MLLGVLDALSRLVMTKQSQRSTRERSQPVIKRAREQESRYPVCLSLGALVGVRLHHKKDRNSVVHQVPGERRPRHGNRPKGWHVVNCVLNDAPLALSV